MSVKRIYVEKRPEYAVEAKHLLWEIRHILLIKSVTGLRLLNRYDVEGVTDELYQRCLPVVFSEPQVDVIFGSLPEGGDAVFAVEYLPGQYDQRAASCEECIQLVGQCDRPTVRTARVYILTGNPNIGIVGTPVGTLLCYMAIAALNLYSMRSLLEQPPAIVRNLVRPFLAAAIMGIFVYGGLQGLKALEITSRLILCALPIAVGVVVYLAAALKLKAVTREDCLLLPKGEKIVRLLKL